MGQRIIKRKLENILKWMEVESQHIKIYEMSVKQYLEIYSTHPNIWNENIPQINNLRFSLKKLEKEKQIKSKVSGKIIRLRVRLKMESMK